MAYDTERNWLSIAEGPAVLRLLVALQPTFGAGANGDLSVWHDTCKVRAFDVAKVLADEPDRYQFVLRHPDPDADGQTVTVRPMTLDDYRDRVRLAIPGAPDVKTVAALHAHFRQVL